MKTTLYRSAEWAYLVESGWSTMDVDALTGTALMLHNSIETRALACALRQLGPRMAIYSN